ncbi:unnamed protein product [Durusdinium trenchii]|uniref:Uncharacterized protein n=1 Tax=Durusdinium trenchii TaxID=1381693 RepID=A0ABP0NW86_9DINO
MSLFLENPFRDVCIRPVVTAPFLPEKKGSAAEMLETLEVRERTSTSATSPEPRRFAWDHGPPDRRASRIGQRDSRVPLVALVVRPNRKRRSVARKQRREVQDELMDSPASKKQARSGTSGTPRRKKGRRGADKAHGFNLEDLTAARAWEKLKSLASLCPAPESCVETALVVKDRIEGRYCMEAIDSERLHSSRIQASKEVVCWGAGTTARVAHCVRRARLDMDEKRDQPFLPWSLIGDFGQLGDNQARSSHTPVRVQGLGPSLVVTAGGLHSCAVEVSGRAKCWGKGEDGLSSGDGQLGFGGRSRRHDARPVAQLGVALDVRAGGSHTCALEAGGAVRCWGWGEFGQLGNGRTRDSLYPLRVQHLDSAIAICSGGLHSCAVETGGSVKCWGWGERGQLGSFNGTQRSSSPFPVEIEGIEDAIDVACGYQHSCAMSQNTTVCWGDGIDRAWVVQETGFVCHTLSRSVKGKDGFRFFAEAAYCKLFRDSWQVVLPR